MEKKGHEGDCRYRGDFKMIVLLLWDGLVMCGFSMNGIQLKHLKFIGFVLDAFVGVL